MHPQGARWVSGADQGARAEPPTGAASVRVCKPQAVSCGLPAFDAGHIPWRGTGGLRATRPDPVLEGLLAATRSKYVRQVFDEADPASYTEAHPVRIWVRITQQDALDSFIRLACSDQPCLGSYDGSPDQLACCRWSSPSNAMYACCSTCFMAAVCWTAHALAAGAGTLQVRL